MRLFIIILFLLGSYTMQANYMKRCYEKNAISYRITMDFTVDVKANLAIWKIYLHLPDDSILLDRYVHDKFYKEDILYDADLSEYIIIGDAIAVDQDVFIVMTRFDKIYLMKYHLMPTDKQVIQSPYYVEDDEEGYDSLRFRYFTATIKPISANQLWVTWYRKNLLRFNCLNDEGFLIRFHEEVEKISGTLPNDLDKCPTEIVTELKKVLNYPPDKKNDTFQYIGYLDETDVKFWDVKRAVGITYFFYKKEQRLPLKVIRYDNYNKIWLFSDYTEKQITVRKASDR